MLRSMMRPLPPSKVAVEGETYQVYIVEADGRPRDWTKLTAIGLSQGRVKLQGHTQHHNPPLPVGKYHIIENK